MSDLISRQAAIDEVVAWLKDRMTDGKNEKPLTERLKDLPSAQPEPKKGKWIKLYAGNYKCSVCGVWFANDDDEMVEDFKYCPNCGAKMEVENEHR